MRENGGLTEQNLLITSQIFLVYDIFAQTILSFHVARWFSTTRLPTTCSTTRRMTC